MFPHVDTRDLGGVLAACRETCQSITGAQDQGWLREGFRWVEDAFAGRNPDYEPLDTRYHDLEHTLQGTLCLARLLRGWHECRATPTLEPRALRLVFLAILLHDTGYLKSRGDHEGTGAKFTLVHVRRSAEFAHRLLVRHGYSVADAAAVGDMIQCTGCHADVQSLPFRSELERRLGYALASADLLGQIAAHDYPEKLTLLYAEFAEAQLHDPHTPPSLCVSSEAELRERTPTFWDQYVLPHLQTVYGNVYRYLAVPPPDGVNEYFERASANIARLRSSGTPHT